MLRALLWKEFREQRQLILAAWGIALVLPLFLVAGMAATTPRYELAALGQMLPLVLMMLVWPVFALATGAMTVAGDMADGSLRFLLSRPVSRSRIWAVKVGAAAAAYVLVVLGSSGIAVLFDYAVAGRFRLLSDGRGTGFFLLAGALIGVLFVGAHYCSLFFRRPLAAALAGAVVVGAMAAVVNAVWMLFVRPSAWAQHIYWGFGAVAGIPLAMAGLLLAAWWVFSRGDLLGGNAARRMAIPLVIVTAVVTLLGVGPPTFLVLRDSASLAAGLPDEARLADGTIALTQLTPSGLSTRIAVVDVRDGETVIVGAHHAVQPTLSSDGSLIAYVRFRGPLRVASGSGEVHVADRNGGGDRVVMAEIESPRGYYSRPALSISPDNRWVALYSFGTALLAPIGDAPVEPTLVRLSGANIEAWRAHVIGWTAATDTELLYARTTGRRSISDRRTEIVAYDPRSGSRRVVAEFPGYQSLDVRSNGWRTTRSRAWLWYPVWLEDREDERLELVDVQTGERVVLSDRPCSIWGVGANGSRFVYGHCTGAREFETRRELHVRDMATGTDELIGVLDGAWRAGYQQEVLLSPDGSRLVMFLWRRNRIAGAYLLNPVGGRQRPGEDAGALPGDAASAAALRPELLASGPYPVGWLDDDHVVLVLDGSQVVLVEALPEGVGIEVVNVESLSIRRVYPR